MKAETYLYSIRAIKRRIKTTDREIAEAQKDVFALKCVDYTKDKVDGGEISDLSDKIAQAEKIVEKLETYRKHLIETREEARERINGLRNDDMQTILIEFFILALPMNQIQNDIHYSRSGAYTLLHKAISFFGKTYKDWLAYIDIHS